ncbi:MAG: ABC transporter substrate-binding protein [Deltaproteobacteria bacterium]|nr:ABC transporter substrate-binding protein [Deltaproteobacteria bacterium]
MFLYRSKILKEILFCLFVVSFSLQATPSWADKKIVKLGFVADITGSGFLITLSQRKALEIGIEEINSSGGLLGRKVELIIRDSQLKPELGAALTRNLILRDRVDFLIGPTSPSVALAVSPVCREYKKLIFFHAANDERITAEQGHRYLFQVIPNTYMEGRAVADFLSGKAFKKIAVIGPDIEYGQSAANAFKKRLSEINPTAQVVKEVWTKSGEQDNGLPIAAIISARPEVVYALLGSGDLAGFIRQGRALGLFPGTRLVGLFDYDLFKGLGKDMIPNLYGFDRAPFYDLNNPQMKTFLKKLRTRTGEYPSSWAVTAYDGLMVLKKAVEKAKALETEKVIQALEGIQWDSLRGPLFIRPFDHLANCGIYFGISYKNPKYSFYTLKDITYIPGQNLWQPVGEIKAMRK